MAFWNRGAMALDDVPAIAAGKLEVRQFVVGAISTNVYGVVSEGAAMVVDPAGEGDRIAKALADVRVELVVATHGHADHVGGCQALVDVTGAKFAMAEADVDLARHARRNHAFGIQYDADAPEPDRILAAGDEVSVGAARFRVLAAPGHTPGGIVFLGEGDAEGIAFVGDTIFAGSAGRTDLPGGNASELMATLARLGQEVPPKTHVLCGHGDDTTMAWELEHNPFLRR
ncbi:MBL fold metallo-hydrolase [uncultured Parolsenella sp.]|uniref:MBL fold metallo-hydrolase n=1 Tax=uncultured Parolsenella sp. TaxID=2083008 RepID=UPI0025F6B3F3|nr:MBL fold metallo-hydrolase [uncultured Parolsenella sp.]